MPCFKPLQGYRSASVGRTGKRAISFNPSTGYRDLPISVPCGQCVGCRIDRRDDWAVRLVHEGRLHELKCFVTLTYDDAHLPESGSLQKRDMQLFLKRLRKLHGKFRYFYCGEYGDNTNRPHYHILLFGVGFPDQRKHSTNQGGNTLYTSDTLSNLWGLGHCLIGAFNEASARYTASYVVKKVTGQLAEAHYQGRLPEFVNMSLKPAIGRGWYDRYSSDYFPSDFVVLAGKKKRVPKYYTKLLETSDKESHKQIKNQRIDKAVLRKSDNTPERLAVRETVTKAKATLYKRTL